MSPLPKLPIVLTLLLAASPAADTLAQPAPAPLPPGRVEIAVEDLHCPSCAKKVARKLYAVRGVKKVSSDVKKDLVFVTLARGATPDPATLWRAVEAGGQTPVLLRFGNQSFDPERIAPLIAKSGGGPVKR